TPTDTVEITPTEPVTNTPAPTPTPLDEAAYEQTIATYLTNLGFASSLPRDEVEDLLFDVARVQLLTTRLFEAYEADVPTEEEQVRVGIIRVSEEDSVEEIEERLAEGEEFTVVAAELSEDQITNLRGGDIGWQSLEDLEARYNEDFAATIFALDEGEVSEMLEDGETFYYFTVFERDVRQLSAQEIRSRRVEEFNAFLDEQRETATIDIREDWVEFIP
ncbi:MAG: peptidylprolyl isomerase, partial [Anaerolineae bacterium]